MAQQNNNQSRQSTSYPSPHSYPSPSMSGYAYPPPTQGQGTEAYRASPTDSHVSLPSLSLPPIRTIDGRPQSQQQQSAPPTTQAPSSSASMGSPLPPAIGQYYHNQGQSLPPPSQHMNVTSDPNQPLRYPLPASDGRIMSGGRHKKEIKRRTKTGCLTCRKRRIKCDEAHPTCRNCQKSKRECLGYDPIFKSQPGPAAIQPALSAAPTMQASAASSSSYPPPPQGYISAAANQAYAPTHSAGVSSPDSSVEPYDYSAAIDPALEGAGTSQLQAPPAPYDGAQDFRQDLKGGLGNDSPYSSGTLDPQDNRGGVSVKRDSVVKPEPYSLSDDSKVLTPADNNSPAKRTKIDDLLALGGVHPPLPTPPTSISPAKYDEIKNIYTKMYASSIDKFLETGWFQLKGLNHLLHDGRLCEQFSALIDRFSITPQNDQDYRVTAMTQSLEAAVIWAIMGLCRRVASTPNPTNGQVNYLEIRDGVHDAVKRLDIFENLVTGQYLDTDPPKTENTRNGTVFDDQLKFREREFWRLMEKFLTIRDDEASSAKEIDDTLQSCRNLLDSRENRDVIYSIAIARHIGQRVAEFPDNLQQPESNDEKDARAKLFVAKRFIEDEANGKATNQVMQRLCGMAMRSWTVRR